MRRGGRADKLAVPPFPAREVARPMPLRIATWNIASVRAHMAVLERFVAEYRPDVLCLQETKVEDDKFPLKPFRQMGFDAWALNGQRNWHGVAVLARGVALEPVERLAWCGKDDARHVAVTLPGGTVLHNFYVPAGGDEPDPAINPKFAHKLDFLAEARTWFSARRGDGLRSILVGDLNVAPLETDVWSHRQLLTVVSHTPVEVERYEAWKGSLDWVDAVRRFVPPEQKLYSWWSYRAKDWAASDRGRRLDHVWVTPNLADRLVAASVVRDARGWEKASDHVPVFVDIDLGP